MNNDNNKSVIEKKFHRHQVMKSQVHLQMVYIMFKKPIILL